MILALKRQRFLLQQPFSPCGEPKKFRAPCQSQLRQCVRQLIRDESGAGFGVAGAEKPTPFWSRHPVPLSDETWLPEWSDGVGERSGGTVRSRGVLGQASHSAYGVKPVG